MRTILLAISALLLSVGPVSAQQNKCGDLEAYQARTDHASWVLFSDDPVAQEFRVNHGLQQLPPGSTKEVVTSNQTCGKVMREVERGLKQSPDWQEIRDYGYEHQVYQFGPYYAAMVIFSGPEEFGWAHTMIFDASFNYIGTVLQ